MFLFKLSALLTGDWSQEEKVDEELIINFRKCFQIRDVPESDSAAKLSSLVDYKTVMSIMNSVSFQFTWPTNDYVLLGSRIA